MQVDDRLGIGEEVLQGVQSTFHAGGGDTGQFREAPPVGSLVVEITRSDDAPAYEVVEQTLSVLSGELLVKSALIAGLGEELESGAAHVGHHFVNTQLLAVQRPGDVLRVDLGIVIDDFVVGELDRELPRVVHEPTAGTPDRDQRAVDRLHSFRINVPALAGADACFLVQSRDRQYTWGVRALPAAGQVTIEGESTKACRIISGLGFGMEESPVAMSGCRVEIKKGLNSDR